MFVLKEHVYIIFLTDLPVKADPIGQKQKSTPKQRGRKKSRPNKISPSPEGDQTEKKKIKRRKKGERTPGEKPFTCDICGKSFSVSLSLEIHKRSHTGEKPFKCETCGKAFSQLSNLNLHKRLHTAEKPFVCDVCGKGFAQKGNLKVHAQSHSDEKPFKCNQCDKAFNTVQSFRRHTILHTGLKPHKCEVCGFAFALIASLNVHKKVHTGEKPHICDQCGAAYARADKLKDHRKKHTFQSSETPPFKNVAHRAQHHQSSGASFKETPKSLVVVPPNAASASPHVQEHMPGQPAAHPHSAEFPTIRVTAVDQSQVGRPVNHFSALFPPYY